MRFANLSSSSCARIKRLYYSLYETTRASSRKRRSLLCDAAGGNNTTPSSKIETSLKSSSSSVRVSNVTRDIKPMPLANFFFFDLIP